MPHTGKNEPIPKLRIQGTDPFVGLNPQEVSRTLDQMGVALRPELSLSDPNQLFNIQSQLSTVFEDSGVQKDLNNILTISQNEMRAIHANREKKEVDKKESKSSLKGG